MSVWPAINTLADEVQSGRKTALSLVEQALKNIKASADHHAILWTTEDRAVTRAKEIDSSIKAGKKAGRLAGVPFVAKDNLLVFGAETTAASNILKSFNAPYQATAINRLEAEGAICVAKTNLDAFGHGASTENSDFGPTKNAHDKSRVPGGSSGGSATAVALDLVPFAIGTDTGGSIRQPSSFSGNVGLKPTYGLVSRSGVIAMASSTDVVGPLTKTVQDASIVLDVMAGKDTLDSTTIERNPKPYNELKTTTSQPKVGVIKQFMDEGLDPVVKMAVEDAIIKLKDDGVKVKTVDLPSLAKSLAVYYILVPAEISSNLSRYDGQRYGYSYEQAKDINESYKKSRSIGFGAEAKRRIMIGTYVLSSGYYDAYYKKAQTVRTKLINEFNAVFEDVDFLIGPVAPTTAFKLGQNLDDPLKMYLADIMTAAASLVGSPAISLPVHYAGNLPVGLQIIAPQRKDLELLTFASQIEELLA